MWKSESLGNVCDFIRGPFGGSLKKNIFVKEGFAIYEQQHAINNQCKFFRYFIDRKKFLEMSRFQVKKGDILMSCSGTIGKSTIVPNDAPDGIINQALLKITPHKELNTKYLKYFMESSSFLDQLMNTVDGAAIKNVASVKILKKIKISFPSLNEQKKIVLKLDGIFSKIKDASKFQDNIKANIDILFKRYLKNLFSEGRKNWLDMELGELCNELFAGGDVAKDKCSKFKTNKFNIPIFTNGEKNKGLYGYTDKARVFKPSITVSARGTIGYSELRKEPFYPAVRLIVVTPKADIIEINYLKYVVKILTFLNTGSSIPQLTIPMIKKYRIKFPKSKKEQKKIINILDNLNKKINELKELSKIKLIMYSNLKGSIINQKMKNLVA